MKFRMMNLHMWEVLIKTAWNSTDWLFRKKDSTIKNICGVILRSDKEVPVSLLYGEEEVSP